MRFVPVDAILSGSILGRNIYTDNREPEFKAGREIDEEMVRRFQLEGYLGCYVEDDFSKNVKFPYFVSEKTFVQALLAVKSAKPEKILKVARLIYDELAAKKEEERIISEFDIRSLRTYTLHHNVSVGMICAAIGFKMRMEADDVKNLIAAGLSHDLGKNLISASILCKKGQLSDEEYQEIMTHPEKSVEVLRENGEMNAFIYQAIALHHENENGSGYPFGKRDREIPLAAKIIHVADVYDALTSHRPYQRAYAPKDAIAYLKSGAEILFSRKVVGALEEILSPFFVGTTVHLSNGEYGLVIGMTPILKRPIVHMLGSGKMVNLARDPAYENILITNSCIMPVDYKGNVEKLNEDRNPAHRRKKVLVVDDMGVSRLQAQHALEEEYEVVLASSGIEALNLVRTSGYPDLILADIDMPGMDGIEMIQKMKAHGMRDVPIIFLSGISGKETIMRGYQVGMSDYLLKPSSPIYVRERVAVALGLRRDNV